MWDPIGTNAPSVSAAIMTIGENKFRVTVNNYCSTTPQTATITITRNNPPAPVGGSAARLTWEPPGTTYPAGRYTITYDPRDAGLYFKFGSVVGIYSGVGMNQYLVPPIVPNVDPYVYNDVAWTPEYIGATYNDMIYVPYDSNGGLIDATFHNPTNLKSGLGDPCRLIGLDLDWIQNTMSNSESDRSKYDNGTWRLPTPTENEAFLGAPTINNPSQFWWDLVESGNISFGMSGGEFPKNSGGVFKFLPASGYRYDNSGVVQNQTSAGHYWANDGGYSLMIQSNEAIANIAFGTGHALPVRCVYDPATLSVNPTIWSPDANPQTSSLFTVTTNQGTWSAASSQPSWCTVSPSSGPTGGNFTITVTPNDGAVRTATITISAGGALPVPITVTQGACVALTSISSLSVSPGGSLTIGTSVSITVTPTPSTATNLVYLWEYNLGSGWYPVLGTTGNAIAVPATLTPTQYRVTVSNGCSSFGPTTPVTITGSGVPTIDPGQLPAGDVLSYVGAFWRGSESGERVIRIDLGSNTGNYGPWMVYAVEYDGRWDATNGDGVMFAPGTSADPYIYTTSPNPAENYQLSSMPGGSYSAFVGGTASVSNPYIEFRIFPQNSFASTGKFQADHATDPNLDANYTTTWPARYAVVYLMYGSSPGKIQKIYLRQGEGSDYVMYDEGFTYPSNHPDGTKRPYSRKISPFNLTDPNLNTETDYVNMIDASTGLLPVRGGGFVDFPTKIGYHFMYNFSRRAYNNFSPTIDNYPTTLSSPPITAWNPATDETCPTGYKRPSAGATAGMMSPDFSTAELYQSLFLVMQSGINPAPTNLTWGLYADGYFDRREIKLATTPLSTKPYPTAVSEGTPHTALAGILYYSAKTNAHIFMPSGGCRRSLQSGGLNSRLEAFGYYGYYLTTTTVTDATWCRSIMNGTSTNLSGLQIAGSPTGSGMSVRCVRE